MKLRQYFQIQELNNKDLTKLERLLEFTSILTEKDPEELKELPFSSLSDMLNTFDLKVTKTHKEIIQVRSKDLYLIPFNQLTLGEWIDLDYYIKKDMQLEIITMLYRQKNNSDWDTVKYEEYGKFTEERKSYILDVEVNEVIGCVAMYINWRESVLRQYSGLFNTFDKVEDYSHLDAKTQREIEQAVKEEEEMKQFAWERLIMHLCDNDVTKFNEILKLPVIQIFNILAMKKTFKDN